MFNDLLLQYTNLKQDKMKSQTLTITGTNLETNQIEDAIIVASNPFMLAQKYIKATQTIYVQSWTLTNAKWNAGNSGLNAGAFLCETLEELTGLDLA